MCIYIYNSSIPSDHGQKRGFGQDSDKLKFGTGPWRGPGAYPAHS